MEELIKKVKLLPDDPGVYIMKNSDGHIIYIGKAKNLKNRVSQYFFNKQKSIKVSQMVSNIVDFNYIVVDSEVNALVLENNLIKKYKPKYNILLKDDKSYPYVKINGKDKFPYPVITRKVIKDGSDYFGPYMCGVGISDVLNIINWAFKIRKCTKKIDKEQKQCLNYHLGLCYGPCAGNIDRKEYLEELSKVKDFLKGDISFVESRIKEYMMKAAEEEDFERALEYKERLKKVEMLKERKLKVRGEGLTIDVVSWESNGLFIAFSILYIRNGMILGEKNYSYKIDNLDEDDMIVNFISQLYLDVLIPPEIVLKTDISIDMIREYISSQRGTNVNINSYRMGVKKDLIDVATKNAKEYLDKQVSKINHEDAMTVLAASRLQEICNLKKYPRRMECYDISHISGTDKIGSMTVFIDGIPDKTQYRKFIIKTVEGNNDFESLKEVINRRLNKLETDIENFPEPDLIVIDGGKGQLSSVMEVVEKGKYNFDIISLAEGNEEIYLPYNTNPIILEKSDYALQLVQRIRDEAHRFAITANRQMRNKRSIKSILTNIEGIGKDKRDKLMDYFKDIAKLKYATIDELKQVDGIGEKQAKKIYDYFRANK